MSAICLPDCPSIAAIPLEDKKYDAYSLFNIGEHGVSGEGVGFIPLSTNRASPGANESPLSKKIFIAAEFLKVLFISNGLKRKFN